jgi:hypothetical protein
MNSTDWALAGETAPDRFLPARVLVLGTVSGGVVLGGLLVGGLTVAARLAPHALLLNVATLFLLGCGLGASTAVLLGFFGCPVGVSRSDARKALLRGVLFVLPAMAMGAVLSGWIAAASIAIYLQSPALIVAVGAAWLLGLGIVACAVRDGMACLQNIRLRMNAWAETRSGPCKGDRRHVAAAARVSARS